MNKHIMNPKQNPVYQCTKCDWVGRDFSKKILKNINIKPGVIHYAKIVETYIIKCPKCNKNLKEVER